MQIVKESEVKEPFTYFDLIALYQLITGGKIGMLVRKDLERKLEALIRVK